MFRKSPNNSKLRLFGCAAYSHKDGVYRPKKFDDCVDIRIYFGVRDGLHRIDNRETTLVVPTEQGMFDKGYYPLAEKENEDYISDEAEARPVTDVLDKERNHLDSVIMSRAPNENTATQENIELKNYDSSTDDKLQAVPQRIKEIPNDAQDEPDSARIELRK